MKYAFLILMMIITSCSSDANNEANPDKDMSDHTPLDMGKKSDTKTITDTNVSDSGTKPGVLPPKFAFQGVAYIGHLESGKLQWIRTDGSPHFGGSIDLGEAIIDLAIDRKRNLLAAALPGVKLVKIFQLDVPKNADTMISDPKEIASLKFDEAVLDIRFDPFHKRLYAIQTPPQNVGAIPTKNKFFIFDTTTPNETKVIGTPIEIPIASTWDIDPLRRILFVYNNKLSKFFGFDLAKDDVKELKGSPIDFTTWYPEMNQSSLKIRSINVDPWSNRIFGARSQGNMSELIAIEYDKAMPKTTESYDDIASLSNLKKLDDGFDLSKTLEERPFILDAYSTTIDHLNGMIWMTASSWNGSEASSGIMSFRADTLAFDDNCKESPSKLMCWYRSYAETKLEDTYHITDGSFCVDGTHRVLVGTSYNVQMTKSPGHVHLFSYTKDGTMTRIAPGPTSLVDPYPVATACH